MNFVNGPSLAIAGVVGSGASMYGGGSGGAGSSARGGVGGSMSMYGGAGVGGIGGDTASSSSTSMNSTSSASITNNTSNPTAGGGAGSTSTSSASTLSAAETALSDMGNNGNNGNNPLVGGQGQGQGTGIGPGTGYGQGQGQGRAGDSVGFHQADMRGSYVVPRTYDALQDLLCVRALTHIWLAYLDAKTIQDNSTESTQSTKSTKSTKDEQDDDDEVEEEEKKQILQKLQKIQKIQRKQRILEMELRVLLSSTIERVCVNSALRDPKDQAVHAVPSGRAWGGVALISAWLSHGKGVEDVRIFELLLSSAPSEHPMYVKKEVPQIQIASDSHNNHNKGQGMKGVNKHVKEAVKGKGTPKGKGRKSKKDKETQKEEEEEEEKRKKEAEKEKPEVPVTLCASMCIVLGIAVNDSVAYVINNPDTLDYPQFFSILQHMSFFLQTVSKLNANTTTITNTNTGTSSTSSNNNNNNDEVIMKAKGEAMQVCAVIAKKVHTFLVQALSLVQVCNPFHTDVDHLLPVYVHCIYIYMGHMGYV